MERIDSFRGEYEFLSNMYPVKLVYEGIEYPSSENAYQAAKYTDVKVKMHIATLTPKESKKYSREHPITTPNWNAVRLHTMYRILEIKFSVPELLFKLLKTGNAELVEGNWWGDIYWGKVDGCGHNFMGKLLTGIREVNKDVRI
jgi:hypothetical protein